MKCSTRLASAALVAALLGLGPAARAQPPADAKPAALAKWLKKRGYVEVALTRNKVGWLDVKVEVDGVPMVFVLDTGANNINLDKVSAARAKLKVEPVAEKSAAIGGAVDTGRTRIGQLAVGGLSGPAETFVIDFATVNAARKQAGEPPCDGILGGSCLSNYSAVIDCGRLKLYLLDPGQEAPDPRKRLEKAGYRGVPLTLNKQILLDANVEVGGVPMVLFLDTGFGRGFGLDRASARRAKLDVTENKGKQAELGGETRAGTARVERLTVGRPVRPTDACVMDFAVTNASRKEHEVPACDGNLGGPFFKTYSAVIDYPHRNLYLLDPPGK